MLTVDNNLSKGQFLSFGMKLHPKTFQNNNYNTNLYPNLQGSPKSDIFVKNTQSSPKDISFGVYFEEIRESYASERIGKVKLEGDYYKKFATEVQKKMDAVWDWTSKRPRYQTYFKKLNIEKPKLIFVDRYDYPDYSSDTRFLKYDEGAPTRYNWINNTIIVDTDYCPNVILVSRGKMALSSLAVAEDFIRNNNMPDPDEGKEGCVQSSTFVDLGKRSLDFALSDSYSSNTNYYSILTPKEAAELAPAFLAHELEHAVAMHVILNTSGINTQKLKDAFNDLNDADMLPPQTTEHWTHTYPYKYRKQLPAMEFGKDDFWKIRDESGNSLKRVKHNDLLSQFFTDPEDFTNLLELDARYASLSYLNTQKFSGFNDVAREKIDFALDFQESTIEEEIRKRLRWTNLSRTADKVRGKKPTSTTKAKSSGGKSSSKSPKASSTKKK